MSTTEAIGTTQATSNDPDFGHANIMIEGIRKSISKLDSLPVALRRKAYLQIAEHVRVNTPAE